MSFNSVGQYVGNFKAWDHLGNVMPNVEHSEGERPAGEFKPAEWLPVKFHDKYFEDYTVVTPGKVVAFDNDGRLCPAQYATSTTNIVYTAADIAQGVIDVRSGAAVTATATFAVSTVSAFMGRTGEAMAVSKPVGVAPYAYKQWCGGDGSNPALYRQHNYNMQHLVSFVADYVLILPLVPNAVSAEAVTFSSATSSKSTGTALSNLPLAKNTFRTPMVWSGTDSALFVNQVAASADVKASGDWAVNLRTGVVTVYATTGTTPSASVAYYTYASNATTVSEFTCAVGNLKPGDFVVTDGNSNYKKAGGSDTFQDIVGQVLEVKDFPRGGLERVRTAYSPALNTSAAGSKPGTAGQMDQLPGSATGGVTDAIHFSGAANLMVTINLISR